MSDRKETICWWCGNPADSREHIFKKTDIKRTYGKAFLDKDNLPLLTNGPTKTYIVQGPNSQAVKFKSNLCQACNNARSSRFDRAYDKFISHISPLFDKILSTKEIDFEIVFGNTWKDELNNLLKYYVKHIGCRLANEGIQVPKNLTNFLNDKEELTDVKIQFEVRPLNKIVAQSSLDMGVPYEVLTAGNLHVVYRTEENKQQSISYLSWITTGWLSVNYIVEPNVNKLNLNSIKKIPVKIATAPLPPEFYEQENIYEKINLIEEYDRNRSIEALQSFYLSLRE